MPPEGHQPVRNTDPVQQERFSAAFEVSSAKPVEPTIVPHYEPARRGSRRVAEGAFEMFSPEAASGPVQDAAAGSFGESAVLEVVIGQDDRVRVTEDLMGTNPWRQICALRISSKTGALYVGTAWFVGPQVLATAGHCVYMQKEGGWVESIDVIPARNGQTEPFGRLVATRFATVQGWIERSADRDFDYGVIFIDDPSTGTRVGNFEVESALDDELVGMTARISGYPADLDRAEFQYYHERPMERVTPTRLLYDIDTFGGQSGSPVWLQVEGAAPIAVGIHTTGTFTGNSGTRISEPILDNLILWNKEP